MSLRKRSYLSESIPLPVKWSKKEAVPLLKKTFEIAKQLRSAENILKTMDKNTIEKTMGRDGLIKLDGLLKHMNKFNGDFAMYQSYVKQGTTGK